jgi:hypothetical protein
MILLGKRRQPPVRMPSELALDPDDSDVVVVDDRDRLR